MNVLNKITLKKLRLNKVRTIVSLVGIILSTCLITASIGLVSSIYKTLIVNSYNDFGHYHVKYIDLTEEQREEVLKNKDIASYYETNTLGYSELNSTRKDRKYIRVVEYGDVAFNKLNVKLVSGRLPSSSNEIVIQDKMNDSKFNKKIGDVITLDVGNISEDESIVDTKNYTYTIVGIVEELYEYDDYYSAITYNDNIKNGSDSYVFYNKPSKVLDYTCLIVANDKDLNLCLSEPYADFEYQAQCEFNETSLIYYGLFLTDEEKVAFIAMSLGTVLVLIVSCILIIKNSFEISVNERNKEYGIFASIGATSKQIKNSVIFEGLIESIVCIPIGILLGVGIVGLLVYASNNIMSSNNYFNLYFDMPLVAILVVIIVSLITILLSCLIPANKISKISPLESIRSNNDIKIKKVKSPKYIKKIFGIGGVLADKNRKRNNKKYSNIIQSITISLVLFIIITTSLVILKKDMDEEFGNLNYNFTFMQYVDRSIQELNAEEIDKLLNENLNEYKEIIKSPLVEKYAYGFIIRNVKIAGSYYNPKYFKYSYDYRDRNIEDLKKENIPITIYAVNDEEFERLKGNLKGEGALLLNNIELEDEKGRIEELEVLNSTNKLTLKYYDKETDLESKGTIDIDILGSINKNSDSLMIRELDDLALFISEDYFLNHPEFEKRLLSTLYIYTNNSDKFEQYLYKEHSSGNYVPYDKIYQSMKNILLVSKIFVYAFIILVSLISITNIFNSISTSMMLRKREFATLSSIGMSDKEFNKMIILESTLYSVKSLIYGILSSLLILYFMISSDIVGSIDFKIKYLFQNLNYSSIIISIIVVIVIILITMFYSLSKIKKENTIETIRNDNI